MRATTSPNDESERSTIPPTGEVGGSAVSLAGESGGATASSDDTSEMTIKGGDEGTASSSREECGFTTGDCGLVGSGLTCTGAGSGGAASLGLTKGS